MHTDRIELYVRARLECPPFNLRLIYMRLSRRFLSKNRPVDTFEMHFDSANFRIVIIIGVGERKRQRRREVAAAIRNYGMQLVCTGARCCQPQKKYNQSKRSQCKVHRHLSKT